MRKACYADSVDVQVCRVIILFRLLVLKVTSEKAVLLRPVKSHQNKF